MASATSNDGRGGTEFIHGHHLVTLVVGPRDIVMGRGVPIQYSGNTTYRQEVATRRVEYMSTGRQAIKQEISGQVYRRLESLGLRFVRRMTTSERETIAIPQPQPVWIICNDKDVIMTKIQQCLREGDKPSRAQEAMGAKGAKKPRASKPPAQNTSSRAVSTRTVSASSMSAGFHEVIPLISGPSGVAAPEMGAHMPAESSAAPVQVTNPSSTPLLTPSSLGSFPCALAIQSVAAPYALNQSLSQGTRALATMPLLSPYGGVRVPDSLWCPNMCPLRGYPAMHPLLGAGSGATLPFSVIPYTPTSSIPQVHNALAVAASLTAAAVVANSQQHVAALLNETLASSLYHTMVGNITARPN